MSKDIEDFSDLEAEFKNALENEPEKPVVAPQKKKGSALPIILFLLLIGIGAGAFFLFQKGSISPEITSKIQMKKAYTVKFAMAEDYGQIELSIDGHPVKIAPDENGWYSISGLPEGEHDFTIGVQGYVETSQKFVLAEQTTVDLGQISLDKKNPGVLEFTLSSSGIEIFLDGKKVEPEQNEQVLTIRDISEGAHSLQVKKQGFKSWHKDFEMPKETGVNLGLISLEESNWREVEIEITPKNNVEVWLNGSLVPSKMDGASGLIVTEPVEPGMYSVELKAKGYETWFKDDFEVYSDLTNSIGPINLTPLKPAAPPKKEEKKAEKKPPAK